MSTWVLLLVAAIHLVACIDQALKSNWVMAINLFGLVIADSAFAFMARR